MQRYMIVCMHGVLSCKRSQKEVNDESYGSMMVMSDITQKHIACFLRDSEFS